MTYKGIDVSHWQGQIDFKKVKDSGIEFVIIKAGGSDKGFYKDAKFEYNYREAKAAGLSVGAYYFVGKNFYGVESGVADAHRFLDIILGKQFEYPIFLDVETTDARYKEAATDAAIAFCQTLERSGYFVGIYASDISGYREKLNHKRILDYTHWVARYGKDPEHCKEYSIFQHSSKGSVPGIPGSVDLDTSRVDFPGIIKEKGFNGYQRKDDTQDKVTKKGTKKKKTEDK